MVLECSFGWRFMRCDGIGFLFLLQNKKNMYDEINFLNFKLYLFRVENKQCNYDKDVV